MYGLTTLRALVGYPQQRMAGTGFVNLTIVIFFTGLLGNSGFMVVLLG